jgi:hypothetical protein
VGGADETHEQNVRVDGDTADIENVQLVMISPCLCHIAFCNYKYVSIAVYLTVLSVTHLYFMKQLNACMLMVAYFYMLQHKLVFF